MGPFVLQVEILEHSHNVTVGYYATKGRLVYLPAVVTEMLGVYGVSNITADLKQHTPSLQSVAALASPWHPQPAGYFQLKTGKSLRMKGFSPFWGQGQCQEDTRLKKLHC